MLKNKRFSNYSNPLNEEINFADIKNFFAEFWKDITIFAALGIAVAALILLMTPNVYEASAQIRMAQISTGSSSSHFSPIGVDIESASALIARMEIPSTYNVEVVKLCNITDKIDPKYKLSKKVKLSVSKGGDGIVDLRIQDSSKEKAKECINTIIKLIESTQMQIATPYINEAERLLKIKEERLFHSSKIIEKADKSGVVLSAAYLSTRDEIRYLLDQISTLQNIINSNTSRTTQLTAPIYIRNEPVYPNNQKILTIGLLLGSLFGVMIAAVRNMQKNHN